MTQPQEHETSLVPVLRAFSRRGLLRRIGLVSAGVVGLTFSRFGLPAPLAYSYSGCRLCVTGPCNPCLSCIPTCYSPAGTCQCDVCCVCEVYCQGTGVCSPVNSRATALCCDPNCAGSATSCPGCTGPS